MYVAPRLIIQGESPLLWASVGNHVDLVTFLLDSGADADIRTLRVLLHCHL